jgi:putative inorganic carbon (hco3(-)) transporter
MKNSPKYLFEFKNNTRIIGAIALSIIFTVLSVLFIRSGSIWLWFIPVALLMMLFAFVSLDKFLLLTVFLVPVSIQLRFLIPDVSADISLPTEIMLAGILVLMIFKVFISREINREILKNPISIISFFILVWCVITSLTSTMPAVSFKSLVTRFWFFAGFYLLSAEIFRKTSRIRYYFYAYIAGLIPVVIYYLIRMWKAGILNQKEAYKAIRPFFNDHTSFGAALAFCIPIIIYFIASRDSSRILRILFSFILILFLTALIFSYSRAAWVSLIVAAMFAAVLLLRISWKIVFPVIAIALIFIITSWSSLIVQLNENKQESSSNIKRHLQSIANIRSDASNMERVNRWKSAIRMFREKPLMGWGPATYQFKYAPFQIASEKTIISTNYGEGGNAHSEYLGSLVDSGIPGIMLYLLLLIVSLRKGIIIWETHREKQIRNIALALVAGLITYVVHGALNNFLDTDKISALFWGMIAAIVAIDIRLKDETNNRNLSQISSDD